MNDINLRIRELRDLYFNKNNVKMAMQFDTNEANIRNYINGGVPKIDFIVAICEKLEINFDWLLTGQGEMLKKVENSVDLSNGIDYKELYLDAKYTIEVQKKYIQSLELEIGNKRVAG